MFANSRDSVRHDPLFVVFSNILGIEFNKPWITLFDSIRLAKISSGTGNNNSSKSLNTIIWADFNVGFNVYKWIELSYVIKPIVVLELPIKISLFIISFNTLTNISNMPDWTDFCVTSMTNKYTGGTGGRVI